MRSRGFTLVELMVTIAIVAILLAIGLPSFQGSLRSNRVATASNELLASLALARSEAIRSPGGAAICTSADGTTCNTGSSWGDGWMVWIDMDGDGLPTGADDRVLRYIQAISKLDLAIDTTEVNKNLIRFDRRGRLIGGEREFLLQPDTCPDEHELVREITLTPTGQARMDRSKCA